MYVLLSWLDLHDDKNGQDWIRVVIGAPLVNGYGLVRCSHVMLLPSLTFPQTETCSAGTYQVKEDVETMQVGVPSSCTGNDDHPLCSVVDVVLC